MATNGEAINGQPAHTNGTNGTTPTPPSTEANPQAFDFRSDVVTRRTPAMTASIARTSEGDDVFGDDSTTAVLEAFVAALTGHEAALLVLSGTMGNQLCIRTHMGQPPHSLVADARSHVIGWEAGGLASLTGALPIPISPSNTHHLTLTDLKRHAILSPDIHACPTTLICLENTLAGTILPLSDLHSVSTWAHSLSPSPLKIHLDGARLWEAVAAGAGSLAEYCALADSVSLCFSKGLGAPIGSIIVGTSAFISRARHIRKAMGGGVRQAGWISAPARVALEETFLGGLLTKSHGVAREIAGMWEARGGRLMLPVETNMVWLDLGHAGLEEGEGGDGGREGEEGGERDGVKKFTEMALKRGLVVGGGRLVVHYQISTEAVRRLGGLFEDIFSRQQEPRGLDIKRRAEEVMEPAME